MTDPDVPPAVQAAAIVINEWFAGLEHAQFMPAIVIRRVVEAALASTPDRESYEETIAVLSDPEAMEGIREGERGISDEFRSGPPEPSALRIVQAQLKATRAEFAQQVGRNNDLQMVNAELYEALAGLVDDGSSPQHLEWARQLLEDIPAALASRPTVKESTDG